MMEKVSDLQSWVSNVSKVPQAKDIIMEIMLYFQFLTISVRQVIHKRNSN